MRMKVKRDKDKERAGSKQGARTNTCAGKAGTCATLNATQTRSTTPHHSFSLSTTFAHQTLQPGQWLMISSLSTTTRNHLSTIMTSTSPHTAASTLGHSVPDSSVGLLTKHFLSQTTPHTQAILIVQTKLPGDSHGSSIESARSYSGAYPGGERDGQNGRRSGRQPHVQLSSAKVPLYHYTEGSPYSV